MISIITTAYNNKDYIKEAIESMISSVGDIEYEILLGIDNCYKTLESVKRSLLNTKYNLKIYFFDNKPGTYIIRNTLVNESKYEKIIFFDSDDVMNDNMVLDVNHFLNTHDLVRPMFKTFTDKIPSENKPTYQYSFGAFGINKTKFLSLNGFEPWVCAADGEFIWRCEMNNYKIKNLQTISFFYRRHENSLTTDSLTNMKSNMRKEYHRIRNMKRQNNNFRSLDKLSVDKYRKIDTKVEFTIIIPTYNVVNYLKECLDSVIKSVKDLSCDILVGIDSCEETMEFVKNNSFDNRIKFYFFKRNVGPYIIKNTLSVIANSNHILFFDSDDIMNEQLIHDVVTYQKKYDLIKPMYLDFKENKSSINRLATTSNTFGEGVFCIKKELFMLNNGFEGWRCAADSDFMKRLYKNNVKLIHTKQIGFYRRIHSTSLTQNKDTGLSSNLRKSYWDKSKQRKSFGPLDTLITEEYIEVKVKNSISDINENYEETNRINLIKESLNFNPKVGDKTINYDVINAIKNNPKIYHPSNNVKPIRENIPVNRNEIMELKKGTLAAQNKEFMQKRMIRDNSNNPFSKKNKY